MGFGFRDPFSASPASAKPDDLDITAHPYLAFIDFTRNS
jgi:hypothetical protein